MQFAKSLCSLLKIILTRLRRIYLILYKHIYMNSIIEKEKKLREALSELKNLDLK